MFGDRVVIDDEKFYPISKEANQGGKKKKKLLRFLIFSCGTRQVPPKDGSEVSTASYQPHAKAKFIPEWGLLDSRRSRWCTH
jgi:hypothetical protein